MRVSDWARQTGDLSPAVTQQLPPLLRREGTCWLSGIDVRSVRQTVELHHHGEVSCCPAEIFTDKELKTAPCTSADTDLDSRDFTWIFWPTVQTVHVLCLLWHLYEKISAAWHIVSTKNDASSSIGYAKEWSKTVKHLQERKILDWWRWTWKKQINSDTVWTENRLLMCMYSKWGVIRSSWSLKVSHLVQKSTNTPQDFLYNLSPVHWTPSLTSLACGKTLTSGSWTSQTSYITSIVGGWCQGWNRVLKMETD